MGDRLQSVVLLATVAPVIPCSCLSYRREILPGTIVIRPCNLRYDFRVAERLLHGFCVNKVLSVDNEQSMFLYLFRISALCR